MRLSLTKCENLVFSSEERTQVASEGRKILDVHYCAVCRTDAKMWKQGHRDLALPRVLGHEFVGIGEDGCTYTVWPGQTCGACFYCRSGRENLCDDMQIIGFHSDGGFAGKVSVPESSLIKFESNSRSHLITFAEPIGCIFNGLSHIMPKAEQRSVVYGGGVVGMLAASILSDLGCEVTVIEQSQPKIDRLQGFAQEFGFIVVKDSVESDFDFAVNCCDSHIAFMLCITKLRKGGKLCFFSGLKKNEEIETNLLNLLHYKEIELYGSYGPRHSHMMDALNFIENHQDQLEMLVENVIHPSEVESVLPKVLSGQSLKYIIDFTGNTQTGTLPVEDLRKGGEVMVAETLISPFMDSLIGDVDCEEKVIRSLAQEKVDKKTKPLGALGKLEKLAVQLATIQDSLNPTVENKALFVFAGDHGVVEEGVSAFPAKVTVQMVENFLQGGAAINVFCRQYDIDLTVVDIGVNGDFEDHSSLMKKKVARGTKNFAITDAMTKEQAVEALENGAKVYLEKSATQPCDLVGMGEMGIGNTSSSTAIISAATGISVGQLVGRGAGVDDKGLEHKRKVLEKAMALHKPDCNNGFEILCKLGGYEIAGMTGAILAATSKKSCVVLDGIISTAAGLIAYLICPGIKKYLVSGHKSVERGQVAALEIMGLDPILDLDFRLGEGTGAAVTMNLIDLSCSMIGDMASFEEAGVDNGTI